MLLPLLAGLLAEGKCTSVDCVQQQSMNEAVTKMDTITTEFIAAQEKVDTTYHADMKVDNDVAYQDPRIEKMRNAGFSPQKNQTVRKFSFRTPM